ncbi:hypothetical protein CFE70_005353 [Pyrenophora teres f. teres 0-1]|uniref:Transcription factor CBF/NF-Y/archaeal histone domain-containing protein n=1 Tax=Pyrenophora teres f. teres (strain 0-1) TaxID=861557 RepID=E3RZE7_PYRTT|nr:hypothetical protein PTT_15014 [Pyrenophora teres f. teres 0-1]KAE8845087.1 hypothetical protein PTNB85_03352 [Pyrenophora teres f. teres]KAE8846709.1 hypothetical protein HRS9122_03616 [Pyrenophora teres f. teres]KAE8865765.1 hypothetical protein PTNB29_02912 [Pyrenophora teres f. teres]KAE8871399.1 hypothetical protein PTNB73_02858 [Pyrenophora teres f. teres]
MFALFAAAMRQVRSEEHHDIHIAMTDEELPPEKTSSVSLARVQKIIQADPERITTSKNAAFAIALATEMFIQHLATTTHNVVKAERKPRRNIQYRDVSSAIAKTDNLEFLVDVAPKTGTWGTVKKRLEEKEKEKADGGKKAGKGKTQTTLDGSGAGEGEMEEDGDAGAGAKGGDEDTAVTASASASASPSHPDQPTSDKAASTPAQAAPEPSDEMDVDQPAPSAKQVEDSEPEEDAAAMQIEMEMRGPPRQPTKSASPRATRRSTGFTAINGSK